MPIDKITTLKQALKEIDKLSRAIIAQDKLVQRTRRETFDELVDWINCGSSIDDEDAWDKFNGDVE